MTTLNGLSSSHELSNSAFKPIKYRIYCIVLIIITNVSSDYTLPAIIFDHDLPSYALFS